MGRPKVNPDFEEKICETCHKPFQCTWKRRKTQRYCCKTCAQSDPTVKKKIVAAQVKTFDEKYGCHPMKTEETKKNLRASMMEKHGVEWNSQIEGFGDAVKKTKLERYGDETYNNSEKSRATCIERYGTSNMLSIYNADRPNHVEKNPDEKSLVETEIHNFLVSILPTDTITLHDTTVLYGKELDFYIKEKKIAIEYVGLCSHSEISGKLTEEYHLNKLISCTFHGVRLIHIFEDEWRDKKEIVKSILSSAFSIYDRSIGARECEIREVSHDDSSKFLDENHIQGADNSAYRYGLYFKDELVALMTFGKTRFSKSGIWEMYRFCNKIDCHVSGGASKLFTHFTKTHSPKAVVSYSDRRYFTGELYLQLGFQVEGNTDVGYHYVSPDYKNRYNRMLFMKHILAEKMEKFDANLTEWENMKANGFDRIWDCGHSKWTWPAKAKTATTTVRFDAKNPLTPEKLPDRQLVAQPSI
jgi:hypothetical protein